MAMTGRPPLPDCDAVTALTTRPGYCPPTLDMKVTRHYTTVNIIRGKVITYYQYLVSILRNLDFHFNEDCNM